MRYIIGHHHAAKCIPHLKLFINEQYHVLLLESCTLISTIPSLRLGENHKHVQNTRVYVLITLILHMSLGGVTVACRWTTMATA